MPFINRPGTIANTMGFLPLKKTWYEDEVDTGTTRTYRFAKRSDHSGVLIQINKAQFDDENG